MVRPLPGVTGLPVPELPVPELAGTGSALIASTRYASG